MVGGFFSAPVVPLKADTGVFIKQGKETPFCAAAISMLDAFKTNRIPEPLAKVFLEYLYKHFPKYVIEQSYLTASERVKTLISKFRMAELVQVSEFILRQIAINEMLKNPLKYGDLWQAFDRETVIDDLRNGKAPLPTASLQALRDALGIHVKLLHVEALHTLPRTEAYVGTENMKPNVMITLQVQGDVCFPQVKHPNDFAYVGQLPVKISPKIAESEDTIASVLEVIAEGSKQISDEKVQKLRMLESMIEAGELSEEQLLDLFVRFYPTEGESHQSIAVDEVQPVNKATQKNASYLGTLLCKQLASWLATPNRIDNQAFYAQLDQFEGTKVRALSH